MSDLRIARRYLSRAKRIALMFAMVAVLIAGLSSRAAAKDELTGIWPPDLTEAYPDWQPGDELIEPIQPLVMKQMAEAVLNMIDGAIVHVDALISESKQIRNTYMIKEHVVYSPGQPYATFTEVVSLLLRDAGAEGKGISSISLVHAEMQKHRDRTKAIAKRYGRPVAIPTDADARKAFLAQQAEEARAIHAAVDWSMRGREYVAMWMLASLAHPDEELEKYQKRINDIIWPKLEEALKDDPVFDSPDVEAQVMRRWTVFRGLAKPYAAEEKRLVDLHVARYLRLAQYTRDMLDQISDQVVRFVNETPPEWGEIPFSFRLYNPIRWSFDIFCPPSQNINNLVGRGLVSFHVYFHTPDDIETPHGTAALGDNYLFTLEWKVPFRPLNAPSLEPLKDELPTYPKYTVYRPTTVPEVLLWGTGIPGPETNDWSHLIPRAVIDEHQLNGRWIIMAVYGQNLFDAQTQPPELTWAPGDGHLDYKLLHSGTNSMEKGNEFDDPQWIGFWLGLQKRNESRQIAGRPALRIDPADIYVVAVHLAENTWAGQYQFKLGDLEINWTLPHATNFASTYFVRTLGIGEMAPGWVGVKSVKTGPDGRKMLYERVDALFLHDQFFVEIETTGDVMTSDRIPFDLYRSRGEGAPELIDYPLHPLYAVRVERNRRLFRSPLIRLNNPKTKPGTSLTKWGVRVYWVPMEPGDRLAARVMPHDVARQGRLATARMYSTPDKVGAFWRGVVVEAARIAKVEIPPQLERMSDGQLYIDVLKKPWKTVDSTPFVQIGGRQIKLKVEHLAAMLLIHKQFIASMEEAVPRLQKMRRKMNANPGWGRTVWAMLKDDAKRKGSPLGDLEVPAWDSTRRITVRGRTVEYFNAYDEDWLSKTFRGFEGHRIEWQNEMAMIVFNGYVGAAEDALDHARKMDMTKPDAEELLRLTTIGMRPMVARLRPNMLRLVEDRQPNGINFRWEYDRQARQSVALIEKLGDEFIKNEAHIDKINSITMLVAAVVAPFLPETYIGQIIATGLSAGSMAITLTRDLPEFIGRENDVRFAVGAYLVIGEKRYVAADLRRKSGWLLALDLAAGAWDVRVTLRQLSHARTAWVAVRSDAELAAIFAEKAETFATLPRETQKAALVRLAQLSDMHASGKTLAPPEMAVLESGSRMIDDLGTFGRLPSIRYLDSKSIAGLEPIIMNDGSIGFIKFGSGGDLSGTVNLSKAQAAAADVIKVPLRIPQRKPWHIFDVRKRIGHGKFAQVYEISAAGDAKRALKVYKKGPDGIADVQGALRAEAMLAKAKIPQLRIIDHGVHDGMAYIVQEFMPAPGLYKPGKPMTEPMQEALLELHVKLAEKKIGFVDGWCANLYFKESKDGSMICGILDQDRMWKYGEGLQSGVFTPKAVDVTKAIFEVPGIDVFGIKSLSKCQFTPEALALIELGYCPWPDTEFLMMKMLEHRSWIKYDLKTRKFVSDRMDIKIVKKYFKRLDHPDSIDTKFDVPPHLRHLLPDLAPGGGQSFNTLPFPKITPWAAAPRVAA